MKDAMKIDVEVAQRVRVELARQRRSAAEVARAIDMDPRALRKRTRAEVGFTVAEIQQVAETLGVSVGSLVVGT